jgi:hypothetical protein
LATTESVADEWMQMFWLTGWVVITGALTVTVVVVKTDGLSTLVAVIV